MSAISDNSTGSGTSARASNTANVADLGLAPLAAPIGPAVEPSEGSAWRAFRRIVNWRNVAVVFYFCLLIVVTRMLPALYYEPVPEWFMAVVRSLRQNLISGLLLLPTIAAVDAAVVHWRLARGPMLLLAVAAVAGASCVAMSLRFMVYGTSPFMNVPYFIAVAGLWTLFGAVGYAIFYMLRKDEQQRAQLVDAECRSQALNAQMLQAELSALQAQIEPHFLFNTLANVKRLYETTPNRGREMLASLIDYLRAVLPSMRENGSTLGRELELARSFLTILQMRMGERLAFSIDAPNDLLATPMPPLILATLLENSIKHGLSPLPEGGRLDIAARRDGDTLVLTVRDSGAGFSGSGGSGVGLANTRSRLAALYGGAASLSLASASPRGVIATVRIPLNSDAAAAPLQQVYA